jgi:hypothetical protein
VLVGLLAVLVGVVVSRWWFDVKTDVPVVGHALVMNGWRSGVSAASSESSLDSSGWSLVTILVVAAILEFLAVLRWSSIVGCLGCAVGRALELAATMRAHQGQDWFYLRASERTVSGACRCFSFDWIYSWLRPSSASFSLVVSRPGLSPGSWVVVALVVAVCRVRLAVVFACFVTLSALLVITRLRSHGLHDVFVYWTVHYKTSLRCFVCGF